jgi:hypothetical protein
MCASKIGSTLGVGEGVGDGEAVRVGDGDATRATVVAGLGDGEPTAACPHAVSNTSTTSKPWAITS